MEKIKRMAENLGVDELWNAAREYLKKTGAIPNDELSEAEAVGDPAGLGEEQQESQTEAANGRLSEALTQQPGRRVKTEPDFYIFSALAL
jgi:hypothetical protein